MSSELITAIKKHDVNLLRKLLARGDDPNAPSQDGWKPLHLAVGEIASKDSPEMVALLIEHGANVNDWDVDRNETPLMSASVPGGLEIARMLLEAGADPNVRNNVGDSPLRLCVWQDDLEMVKLLLQHGASKTIDDFGGDFAWTALGIAAHKFNLPMIELLLEAGADPPAEDDIGRTARDHLPPRETRDPQVWDQIIERLGRKV